jgi:hypothetical protein
MTKHPTVFAAAIVVVSLGGAMVRAQGQSSAQPAATKPAWQRQLGQLVPLKVQIVISKYQGDKKISSLPYTLSVNANDGHESIGSGGQYSPNKIVRLRMGAQVPVPSMAMPVVDGKQMPTAGPVQYKDVGTNIDCWAWANEDDRFNVSISIEDSSVYADGQTAQGAPRLNDIPTFRSFRSEATVILKDGQTSQFTAATDKVSGETTRVDVTITVVK